MTKQRLPRRSRHHRGVRLLALKDGRHVARWNDPATGALRQETLDRLGLTNREQRRKWAVTKSEDLKASRLAFSLSSKAPEPVTVAEAVATYGSSKPIAANTASARKGALADFATFCEERGIVRLDQATAPKLWAWRDGLVSDTTRQESTRNLWLAIVAAFLRWAQARDHLPLLPLEKIKQLAARIKQPAHVIEFLRPAELRAVLEAAIASDALLIRQRRPVAALLLTMFLSGMRYAEVAGLDWREVDFAAREIRLPAERVKNRRARVVAMGPTPMLANLLSVMREKCGRPTEGLVFAPLWQPQVFRNHQDRIAKESGVEFTPHMLRRTCGTYLTCAPSIFGGASAWHSAKRLGHSVNVAEKHYAGALSDLPATATTLEAAAGIEDLAQRIIDAIGKGGS